MITQRVKAARDRLAIAMTVASYPWRCVTLYIGFAGVTLLVMLCAALFVRLDYAGYIALVSGFVVATFIGSAVHRSEQLDTIVCHTGHERNDHEGS